jgi:hypothetical protein
MFVERAMAGSVQSNHAWRSNCIARHRKECEGGYPEDSRTGQFEEARRGWRKCSCLIHAVETLGAKFSRRQTGKATEDFCRLANLCQFSVPLLPVPHDLLLPLFQESFHILLKG